MRVKKEEKRFWVPTIITVGAASIFFGLSVINSLGLCNWAGWFDIGVGLVCIWLGFKWYEQSKPGR